MVAKSSHRNITSSRNSSSNSVIVAVVVLLLAEAALKEANIERMSYMSDILLRGRYRYLI